MNIKKVNQRNKSMNEFIVAEEMTAKMNKQTNK